MHSIRSRARHSAWSSEDPPPYSALNPFRRVDSRPRAIARDLEQGHPFGEGQNHSESCINDPPHTSGDATFSRPKPQHSATVPLSASGSDEPGSPHDLGHSSAIGKQSDFSKPPVSGAVANGDDTEKHHKFPFLHRKKNDDGGEVKKTKSRQSTAPQKFGFWPQIKAIFGSWINIMLVCVPTGIALHYANANYIAVFTINFLAIMPLAGLLSYATEELALRVGETLGGLLNASFGNAVELIVSIIALTQNQIIIVQTSLIGSILSNLLLVLGMCFFFGGINRMEQFFNVTVAQTAASLLSLAVGALIIPTVFHRWGTGGTATYRKTKIPALSRGTAIILLFVYGCYLFFQLKSHREMYNAPSQKSPKRKSSKDKEGEMGKSIAAIGAGSAAHAGDSVNDIFTGDPETAVEEEKEVPQISVISAIILLCVSTAFVGLNSEYMVDSIGELTREGGISPEFVGLILIPIVGNAAEHATAVTVAVKDKMDLAIGVAVGSSMQIALLVLPIVVVIGWIIGNNQMTLEFDGFLLALLFVSVLLVNYLIGDGRSHWLEGVMLMTTYVIIAVAAWFYPAGAGVVG